jgi:iron complex transport system substrate-binding protein
LGWARALPSVGQGLEPNMEALVALEPDLVVRFAGTQDPRTPQRLDDLGIPHLAIRPDRVSDIYRITQTLGIVTGHVARADSLAAWIHGSLGQLSARAAGLPPRRVAYVLGGTPPWVAGPGTYIDDVLSLAGGQNVFSDLDVLYSSVSPEQLRSRDIEIVLLATEGALDPSLTPGARIAVIGDALEIPGPGVVEAAYHVSEVLHGMPRR